jgi:hypothetical protein
MNICLYRLYCRFNLNTINITARNKGRGKVQLIFATVMLFPVQMRGPEYVAQNTADRGSVEAEDIKYL